MATTTAAKQPPVQPPAPEPQLRGWSAFWHRRLEKFRSMRPDHSEAGFVAAIREAITYTSKRDWNSAQDLEEELEARICTSLRVPGGVYAEYVARNRETKETRVLFLTDWGLREAVEGQLSFSLHYKPERIAPKAKG